MKCAEDLEDISVEYEENGVLLVKQEAVEIISRGGWPVLLFLTERWTKNW